MKGWITAVLAVTFLSGTSTGYLICSKAVPDAPPTRADRYVEQARQVGVTKPADLERIRAFYEEWEEHVRAQRDQVMKLLGDQLAALNREYSQKVQEIIDTYRAPDDKR